MSTTKADVLKKAGDLEGKLKGKLFLGGAKPSDEDVKAFNDLLGAGNNNIYRWVKNLASYTEAERKAFGAPVKVTAPPVTVTPPAHPAPAAPAAPAAKAEAEKKTEAPKKAEEPKKAEVKPAAPAADDDDDVDLFGEETEEEKAAAEAKKKKDAEKKDKKVVIAKSSILIDIKPWDDTTDLKALAAKLHAIEKDGLIWGDHKLVPVAFGLKKLQQLIVIEDDKVSGDDIEEMICGFEDDVQSMDIVAWNKI